MLKSISNLGTILKKDEQRTINGGQKQCPRGWVLDCDYYGCWCINPNERDDDHLGPSV
ncbi:MULTISPECIES: hypothetical protein [unclassified Tenacibaculum]|uniref:hypothetical protein n=1 Tax=unclassified Tenacibaculum TaxID=2635139 RepID=UPI001F2DCB44|nr:MULTISPECIES: hypothetical protein [unclassified Tenacibaculum]MCF2873864.1 hypothetical protein [Tenacibaculum sp. Cn5-1]MCF2936674.1 hypothetical protein [Tenacibaculum sp. Cn5-34]MCG7512898.1 hypothetical protein [Tenacibaculum sp. Cn5-46]